jgi:hypothetical protein
MNTLYMSRSMRIPVMLKLLLSYSTELATNNVKGFTL